MKNKKDSLNEFSDLVGKVLIDVKNVDDELITFTLENGDQYALLHHQDCCESVYVEDVVGELSDLVGSVILMAEEVSNVGREAVGGYSESYTWTYYKLATMKGYVTIRFYGSSNGYYSEGVSWSFLG